jgi:hypothetical protein
LKPLSEAKFVGGEISLETKGRVKCKLALWLALNNKLCTWDNGLKRGWIGPSRCSLCRSEEETIYHLFITCPFFVQVWSLEKSTFTHFDTSWDKNTLSGCLLD